MAQGQHVIPAFLFSEQTEAIEFEVGLKPAKELAAVVGKAVEIHSTFEKVGFHDFHSEGSVLRSQLSDFGDTGGVRAFYHCQFA